MLIPTISLRSLLDSRTVQGKSAVFGQYLKNILDFFGGNITVTVLQLTVDFENRCLCIIDKRVDFHSFRRPSGCLAGLHFPALEFTSHFILKRTS